MDKRLRKFIWWLGHMALFSIGGVVLMALLLVISGETIAQLVHETHGLIGFIFGFLFMLGGGVSALIFWLITGKSLPERLLFGEDWNL